MVARGRRLELPAGEKWGSKTGPSPVDRGRAGSKHHLLVDCGGLPLAWALTAANRNDVTQLLELLDGCRPLAAFPRKQQFSLLDITSFLPTSATPGTDVVITGHRFRSAVAAPP
jgi:hypothetical protein